ncbi:LysR family transcriptional regulator [Aliiglaciecola sp. M165]|uniref:LysR family transcriptional regulator n=1 Tax=Aliiglaciecola sp. M165 TaxID=2593649 RepID=UPI00117C01A6|nr:LysR family transcriptional regulator [Aliiglaciecola sp. M165]TRY28782.1 LysR family transcriptional regulator [Aliiglaciecola sp. M165]
MDTIDGMKTFVAVASKNSFTQGAILAGLSTKLASKYIAQLEDKLGAQLFNRTTRNVSLTDTGAAYLKRCIPILEQLDELENDIHDRQKTLSGPIRIAAPTGFGSSELINLIQPFIALHPEVEIDLNLSDQRVAIVEEGIDLAFRFGKLNDSNLVAKKLTEMRMVVFASHQYLSRFSRLKDPHALSTHNCLIQKSSIDPNHWQFDIQGKIESIPVSGNFSANSPRAVASMVVAGEGIGRCPIYTVEPFLAANKVEILFEDMEVPGFSLYAIYPQSRHLTSRVRALIDFLVEALKH